MSKEGVDKVKLVYFEGVRGKGEFIRLVLKAGAVELEDVRIPIDKWKADPSHKKDAPHGQLPYAVYRGRTITQSIPIASYFAKKCGLYGQSEEDALRQEEVMHLGEDLRFPNLRDWYMASDDAKKAEIEQKLKTEVFPRYLGYLETLLKDNGDSGFFVGDSVTLADIHIYEMMVTVQGIHPEALSSFPLLRKMCDNVTSFPPLKEHLATRPFYKV